MRRTKTLLLEMYENATIGNVRKRYYWQCTKTLRLADCNAFLVIS